jgi:hypothetical protein
VNETPYHYYKDNLNRTVYYGSGNIQYRYAGGVGSDMLDHQKTAFRDFATP